MRSSSEITQATRLVARARRRAYRTGAAARISAPTSGVNATIVRIGMSLITISFAASSGRQHEERAGHDDQAERDPERVVLDPPGLHPAEPAAGADGRDGDVVDRVV